MRDVIIIDTQYHRGNLTMGSSDLFKLLQMRRTIHRLGKDRRLDKESVTNILQQALLVSPSFFNSQTTRMVLLLDDENNKLWEIVGKCLEECSNSGKLEADTVEKLNGFKGANGTILFFEDHLSISHLTETPRYDKYQGYFNSWSEQTNAMHQYVVWSALCAEGLGVTIQHYNPLIDRSIAEKWNIDSNWQLVAQMVFGKSMAEPKVKTCVPLDKRLFIYS